MYWIFQYGISASTFQNVDTMGRSCTLLVSYALDEFRLKTSTVFGPSAFFLNRSVSKSSSFRRLMILPTYHGEAAFSRMSRETTREVSSISSWLKYPVGMIEREGGISVN